MSTSQSVNPYAAPAVPVELDFREAAAAESLRLWEANPGKVPDALGMSLVLPAEESGPAWLKHIRRMMLLRLVLGIGGIAVGGCLAAVSSAAEQTTGLPNETFIAAAMPFSLGGIALLLANVFLVRRMVRRGIGERHAAAVRHSELRPPLCVGVEDARTFVKMKIAPEDFAWVAFDVASRRLILEGLIFRYIICGPDVLSVAQVAGATSSGIQLVFRVGTAVVGVTLQYDSIWHEVKRQTIGANRDPLLQPIRETLGLERQAE